MKMDQAFVDAYRRLGLLPFLAKEGSRYYWVEAPENLDDDTWGDLNALAKAGLLRGPFNSAREAYDDMRASLMSG
jgi:hypothetical protein